MHAYGDSPLSLMLINLAFVRGAFGPDADERSIRVRIAVMAWLEGAALVVWLAASIGSLIVGAAGISLLLVGLTLFVERGDRIADFLRGRFATND